MHYKQLEEMIQSIAYSIWNTTPQKVQENGINHDTVVKIKPDHWIVIETSVRNDLDKIREDLTRLVLTKNILLGRSIYCECYFVSEKDISLNVKNTGKESHINIISIKEFQNMFFNFGSYSNVRMRQAFGSSIDPHTGEIDKNQYIKVKYTDSDSGKHFSIEEIGNLLIKGSRIILIGDYGTGKSRCQKEVFLYLSKLTEDEFKYPISINLKDNWGLKRSEEIIRRHFSEIGISEYADTVLRNYSDNRFIFLLDGFDEIGTQSWSNDPEKIVKIRKDALLGVKELICRSNGGVLVSGRDFYFNSDKEMIDCLGLNHSTVKIICVKDEFSEEEVKNYLESNLGRKIIVPEWMPKRPLVFQMLSKLDSSILEKVVIDGLEYRDFWGLFIEEVCNREAKINLRLDSDVIKKTLVYLSRITRLREGKEYISLSEIEKAFETVTGKEPIEESSIMLQRLPFLKRIGAESQDRQFYDLSILNILRAKDIIEIVTLENTAVLDDRWCSPLNQDGISYISAEIEYLDSYSEYLSFMLNHENCSNTILLGDIVASLFTLSNEKFDFKNLEIRDSHILQIDASGLKISNIQFIETIINVLNINGLESENVHFKECMIGRIVGIAAASSLPEYIENCLIDEFETLSTTSRIKQADLLMSQKIFLSIIKKTFFQPGSGRKEEALFRGFGAKELKKIFEKTINYLVRENILSKTKKGDTGYIYNPNRKYAERMKKMKESLNYSEDPIWVEVSKFNE